MDNNNDIQLDHGLQERIGEIASANGISPAEVIREAIESYWPMNETWGERAERLGLVGCVDDAPEDLSTNPKYFEGFGRE
jgi:hypothetical protein